jgi:large subunit ribosomal protein L18
MNKKLEKRIRLKKKIRTKILGTSERPRLSVFRSNQYIYAQIIDDNTSTTLASASDLVAMKKGADGKKAEKPKAKTGSKIEKAKEVGTDIAKKANAKGVTSVVFDRNGFKYTGRIKALADQARASGLKF